MRWCLVVALMCISLMISDVEHLFMYCWPFIGLLWTNIYRSFLFIFESDFFFVVEILEFSIYPGYIICKGFHGNSDGKESACFARNWGSIPGSGRSPGVGSGYLLQYSCLENPIGRGTWRVQSMESQRPGYNWSDWTCTIIYKSFLSVWVSCLVILK